MAGDHDDHDNHDNYDEHDEHAGINEEQLVRWWSSGW